MEYKHFAGQSKSVDALFSGIESGRIAHAVIIEGSGDSRIQMLAGAYAKAILCSAGRLAPCNACKPCKLFSSGNHPDYITIFARKSASVGVEDVAQLLRHAYILPNEGGRKVFVIDDAHLLTPPAQNKLLKLLEEPPLYLVIILLCGNISSILPTVLSRCIRIRMPRLPRRTITDTDLLKIAGLDENSVQLAADPGNGMMGSSINSSAKDAAPYNVFFGIEKPGGRIIACEYLTANRPHAIHIINIWQCVLRDCLVIANGGYDIINCPEEKSRMERYAQDNGVRVIINKLDMLCQAEERLQSNCQYAIVVDWLMSVI